MGVTAQRFGYFSLSTTNEGFYWRLLEPPSPPPPNVNKTRTAACSPCSILLEGFNTVGQTSEPHYSIKKHCGVWSGRRRCAPQKNLRCIFRRSFDVASAGGICEQKRVIMRKTEVWNVKSNRERTVLGKTPQLCGTALKTLLFNPVDCLRPDM